MRRTIGVAVLAAAVVALAPTAAHADVPVTQVGWWTRAPSPPTVPEGGIAVGAAPDGDLTIGALVIDAGEGGATGTELRLVETGGQGQQVAGLQVCPTSTTWSAAKGEPMTDAPKDDCKSATVAMKRAEDGATWTAEVQKLVEGKTDTVGLIVKPASGSVAFQISFAPPSVAGEASTESSDSA